MTILSAVIQRQSKIRTLLNRGGSTSIGGTGLTTGGAGATGSNGGSSGSGGKAGGSGTAGSSGSGGATGHAGSGGAGGSSGRGGNGGTGGGSGSSGAGGAGGSTGVTSGFADIVSEQLFNQMFPKRNMFYSYQGLVQATKLYPGFASEGTLDVRKREAAAFLANMARETGELVYIEQIAKGPYCQDSAKYPCAPGQQYYGRGPIQISWNYNYGAAGDALGVNLSPIRGSLLAMPRSLGRPGSGSGRHRSRAARLATPR